MAKKKTDFFKQKISYLNDFLISYIFPTCYFVLASFFEHYRLGILTLIVMNTVNFFPSIDSVSM